MSFSEGNRPFKRPNVCSEAIRTDDRRWLNSRMRLRSVSDVAAAISGSLNGRSTYGEDGYPEDMQKLVPDPDTQASSVVADYNPEAAPHPYQQEYTPCWESTHVDSSRYGSLSRLLRRGQTLDILAHMR